MNIIIIIILYISKDRNDKYQASVWQFFFITSKTFKYVNGFLIKLHLVSG